jgi:hypothetical protein
LDSLHPPSVCQRKQRKPRFLSLQPFHLYLSSMPDRPLARDSFTKLGRMAATETIKVLLSTNTQTKTAVRKLKSRSQWRYALHRHKSYARALWIWIEIDTAIGEFATFEVTDPDSPEAQKIKLQPGESVKVSNLPNHSGSFRAYARCDEEGPGWAGHEDAAIKWG